MTLGAHARRALLALMLAAGAIVAMEWWLDARLEPAVPRVEPTFQDMPLLETLEGRAAHIWLADALAAFPADAAPVVAVDTAGGVRSLRAAPMPRRPDGDAWQDAGVVLGDGRVRLGLADLSAAQRATLLRVLAALSGRRGLLPGQVVVRGLRCEAGELEALLHWLR